MESTVQIIPLSNLAIAFVPVLLVIALLYKWSLEASTAFYSIARMLVQLIIVERDSLSKTPASASHP
jgi:putative ABC transport system permease protein